MNPDVKHVCDQIVRDVLEEYAYMMVDEENSGIEAYKTGSGYVHAMITFVGPRAGVVEVITPTALSSIMAANVLGVGKETVSQDMAEDALKEFVNIVCGRLTATLCDERAVFSITAPSCRTIDPGKWLELCAQPDSLRWTVEGHPIVADIVVQNTAA